MFKRLLAKFRKPLTREEELARKYKGMKRDEIVEYLCENERYEELKEMSHYWFADNETRELCSAFEGCPITFFMEYMELYKDEKYKYDVISLYDEDHRSIFFWDRNSKAPSYPNNYVITKLYYTGFSSGFYGRVRKVDTKELISLIKEMHITETSFKYLSRIITRTRGDFYIPRKDDSI